EVVLVFSVPYFLSFVLSLQELLDQFDCFLMQSPRFQYSLLDFLSPSLHQVRVSFYPFAVSPFFSSCSSNCVSRLASLLETMLIAVSTPTISSCISLLTPFFLT